ncbi:hypothetical protein UFOVP171_19 [uncultured Caudovirales phage]|uniref:Uncharacterized protein n=1 Tax=uncultured Caudovirales phage TaxID=2100421 RepID=A0A6J7WF39_9CAUD|nr:hypothetical protein UFOVP171_19 [uncultured Caudovirales phage]
MADNAPWLKYSAAQAPEQGPWSKYAKDDSGYVSSAGEYPIEMLRQMRNVAGGFVEAPAKAMTSAARILGLQTPEEAAARRENITSGLENLIGYEPAGMGAGPGRFFGETALTAGIPAATAGAAGLMRLAPKTLNYLTPALESAGFGRNLSLTQRAIGGGVTGGTTGALTSEDPTVGAMGGAMLGTVLPMAPSLVRTVTPFVQSAAKGAYSLVEPLAQVGKEAVINRTIRNAFAGDEATMQQAIDMLRNGATLRDVAVAFDKPVLAGFVNAAERVPFDDIVEAYAQKRGAENLGTVNQLLGAQQAASQAAEAARAQGAAMVTAAEQALEMTQQRLAANNTLTAQQKADALQNAQAALAKAKQNLLSLQSEAGGLAAGSNQLLAQNEAARRAEIEAALPTQRPEVIGGQLEQLAKAKESAASNAVRARFNEVREAGAGITGLPVDDLVGSARNIISDAAFAPGEAPEVAKILARMSPTPQAAPDAFSAMYGGATQGATKPATAAWQDLIDLREAINKDIRAVSGNIGAAAKRGNLLRLRGELDQKIQSLPDELVPPELKQLDSDSVAFYKETYVKPFRVGKTNINFLLSADGQPKVPVEKAVDNFFQPLSGAGVTKANRFMDMLGDNEEALDVMRRGILDVYRRKVAPDGVMDATAHAKFMRDYGDTLRTFEQRGLAVPEITQQGAAQSAADAAAASIAAERAAATKLSGGAAPTSTQKTLQQLSTEIPAGRAAVQTAAQAVREEPARVAAQGKATAAQLQQQAATEKTALTTAKQTAAGLPATAESVAAEAGALSRKYNVAPDKLLPTVVRDLPEAQAVVADVNRALANSATFEDLAARGDKLSSKLLDVKPADFVKAPMGILKEIIFNIVSRRLTGMARKEQAAEIATALLNEGTTAQFIERALKAGETGYGAGGSRIRKALSPDPLKRTLGNTNALSNSQNVNQLGAP